MNWESQTFNATSYIVFLFTFGLIVPVIVIVPSYVKIILTMRENSLRMGRVNKVEGRVTIMIFIMILGENINLKLQLSLMSLIIPGNSLLSFLASLDTLCNFCFEWAVWRSGAHHPCVSRSSRTAGKVQHMLQSTDLCRHEFSGFDILSYKASLWKLVAIYEDDPRISFELMLCFI